jgi:diacylglycerol kinase family enzyme
MTDIVLVNAKSGAVRDRGRAAMKADLEEAFVEQSIDADVRMLGPRDLVGTLKKAIADSAPPERIIVGGGDGSISVAAGLLANTDVALGVLPLGTMNLLARAIEMPLDPIEAVGALGRANPVRIDMFRINEHPVLLHASIGLQPKIIRLREALHYRTRFARLVNGAIAWMRVTRRLHTIRVSGETDTESFEHRASAILISNNALPEGVGETPVAQDMTHGELGVYMTDSRKRGELVRLALATSLGIWRESDLVEEFRTGTLEIDASNKKSLLVSIDGEVRKLETPLQCQIVPRCLSLLMP